jgi:hypothetical protein
MPTKNRINIAVVGTLVAMLATFSVAVGGYYQTCERVTRTAEELVSLRVQHSEDIRVLREQADVRWEKVNGLLSELLTRGVRNETNINTILELLRKQREVK